MEVKPETGLDVYAAGSAQAGLTCGVCFSPILSGDEIVFCKADNEAVHRECWEHNKGCPRFGCEHGPSLGESAQALSALTGAADYQCPKCRKHVQPNLLRCSYCARPFELQEVVSSLEYEDFLYHASDDSKQQKFLWLLLLMTCTIVLAPLACLVLSLVKLRGNIGPFRTKHMLTDSWALFYITLCLSSFFSVGAACLIIFK